MELLCRQTEMQTAEPLVSEPSSFKVKTATKKLKIYKSLGTDQILAETIQVVGSILCSEIHKLNNSVWNKEELLQQWMETIIVHIYKKNDKTGFSNYRAISLLLTKYKILSHNPICRCSYWGSPVWTSM
jgi:hypothetical protein